ncbi:ornithine cyclodeaminase family protein [Halomonas alkalisoli]|uniref:ornithine cyclodeaminase family protein n=1 Tax=Halomonas alkalisoli TaxID=2907158 RepID=UPI001F438B14|nr:ornithine cyclodeaminase family protein [Halomonas alkalisoli]MCE9681695.1 ornithine cyclodeaminase family protein [Halomonas alkalisoli]
MIVISEQEAQTLISMDDAIAAMEAAFLSLFVNEAFSFPVVREALDPQPAVFGVKSGRDRKSDTLGLKVGGYWSENHKNGKSNHQSCTLLLNTKNGEPAALLSSNYLTGLRTAAIAGLATRYLTEPYASSLALIGAGGQALFQLKAMLAVRPIRKLFISSRSLPKAEKLAAEATELGVADISIVSAEAACREASIITTITPSSEPVVFTEWISPGTHINAVGSDTRGKKELDPLLLTKSVIVVDNWLQASKLGECQSLQVDQREALPNNVYLLSSLVGHDIALKESSEDITVFDSTGLAIQDLAIARLALDKAISSNRGVNLEL